MGANLPVRGVKEVEEDIHWDSRSTGERIYTGTAGQQVRGYTLEQQVNRREDIMFALMREYISTCFLYSLW